MINWIKNKFYEYKHRRMMKKYPCDVYWGTLIVDSAGNPQIDKTCSFGVAYKGKGMIDLTGNTEIKSIS